MTASEPIPILCHGCGHDVNEHALWGCQTSLRYGWPDKAYPYGQWRICGCDLAPSDIAREYARQRVADELRVAAVVARDTRWNVGHVDEQRVTRDGEADK